MDSARQKEELSTERRAALLGFKYVNTSQIQKQLYKTILSVPELYRDKIVPLVADEHYINFGITTNTSQQTLSGLRKRFTDQRLDFSIISDTGWQEFMHLYDPPKKVEYQDIDIVGGDHAKNRLEEVSATLEKVRADDMLAYLVQQAYQLKASDIHLENQRENVRVRLRVDGVLHPVAYLSREKYHHLVSSIASSANVSTDAKDAQSGHISRQFTLATGEPVTVNLRVETVPAVYGMDVVMRLFNLKIEYFQLDNLGLDSAQSKVVQDIIAHPTGMVMVVGPTGSGKTTTLYSIINTLNKPERKIITLEDPVEYNLPGVVQIPVEGQLEGQGFAEKLRAVLRLDPDVVMVGEIRDPDTAKTALQGALTGHLVLSTFHAANAVSALTRLQDMVGANPLFASAIRLIMAQRLVRRLDDATKQAYQPDQALKDKLQEVVNSLPPGDQKPDLTNLTLYRAGSSPANPFGYSGQLAIREQLMMTPGVQAMLGGSLSEANAQALEAEAVREGLKTMLADGVLKAIAGLTSIEEVYRVAG